MKQNQEQDLGPRLIRISELLLRSREIIQAIQAGTTRHFRQLYSRDSAQAWLLMDWFAVNYPRWFKSHQLKDIDENHTIDHYTQILAGYLKAQDFLPSGLNQPASLAYQLEQVWARWAVHEWALENKDMIKWLHRRRDFYPVLLARLAITEINLNGVKILPYVKIDSMVALLYRCVWSHDSEEKVAEVLSTKENHLLVANFAAQLDQVEPVLKVIESLVQNKLTETLHFVFSNPEFFAAILGDGPDFSLSFVDYVDANPEAKELLREIKQYNVRLRLLFQPENGFNILNDSEKQEYFGPLLNHLLTGVMSKRLPLLLDLYRIRSRHPQYQREVLRVITWIEKYREILTMSLLPQSSWQRWLDQNPAHKQRVQAFSDGLSRCIRVSIDTRPAKEGAFPSPLACFSDCFSGLPSDERITGISCHARDVLLYSFLMGQKEPHLAYYFVRHMNEMSQIMDSYQRYQDHQIQDMMTAASTEVEDHLREEGLAQGFIQQFEGLQVSPQRPAAKPRNLNRDFDQENTNTNPVSEFRI